MSTFTRVVPIGQLPITRHELEQAGATNITWGPAAGTAASMVTVTAILPGLGLAARPAGVVAAAHA